MKSEIASKKEMYKAAGFALMLIAASFPLSIVGLKLLNFVLGQIPI